MNWAASHAKNPRVIDCKWLTSSIRVMQFKRKKVETQLLHSAASCEVEVHGRNSGSTFAASTYLRYRRILYLESGRPSVGT